MLRVEGIVKEFRPKGGGALRALDGVSLAVAPGGMTALLGPDGAGKTTLLRIIAGLLRADAGTLAFAGGAPAAAMPAGAQAHIGYMPQKFGLYEDLSVQENLDLYADLKGVPHAARAARYRELLDMCAMSPFTARLAGKLSGGMKQKLGLICTLVAPPRLLLLDEPTVGVDPLSRRELWDIVARLTAGSGMAVIVSTSYLDEAERCGEAVLLHEGRTLARGTPQEICQLSAGMARVAQPAAGDAARALQARLFAVPGMVDAVPQGGAVRFVHGALDAGQQRLLEGALRGAAVQSAPPALEDSFMLLLRQRQGY
ncbi:MAG: ABC transporter ATP-binding protein, partial [Rhodocyclaceae bacterium]|nr:ABC transporter ATP-binding protein [Rhodocyclaceae bacterium]